MTHKERLQYAAWCGYTDSEDHSEEYRGEYRTVYVEGRARRMAEFSIPLAVQSFGITANPEGRQACFE